MSDETRATEQNRSDAVDLDRPSLEAALTNALARLRDLADATGAELAKTGDDDYWKRWATDVLERRPIYIVGVVQPGETDVWLMEPSRGDAGGEGVLHAAVTHDDGGDVARSDRGHAKLLLQTKTHADVAQAIGWLIREKTGEPSEPERSPLPPDED